jgi:uncharacterized protein
MSISVHDQNNRQDLNKKIASFITNKSLELIILPTEQCNFRCTYCYEDFSIGRMSIETVSAIKLLLNSRAQNLHLLKIAWFGGEPLVAKNVILDICKYAASLTDKYPDLRYISNMTTNGYLLNIDTVHDLLNVGVQQYQISIDGSREIHNQSRLRADGKGTFDQIWDNLLAIRNSPLPVKIDLRLHFTVDTFQLLDTLIADLKREFLPDSRFSFYFKAIEQLGGVNDVAIKTFSAKEKSEAIRTLKFKLFSTHLDSFQNKAVPDDYVCYASKPNSLVIRANGTVGKCTVALSDERNNVGLIQSDGTLKLTPSRLTPWVRGIESLDIETLSCPLVYLPTSKDIKDSLQEKMKIHQM